MPDDWKPAILWTRVLLDLPALQRVAFGLPPTEWMTRDEVLAPRLGEPPDDERARRIRRAWLETWRSLWPATSGESRLALEEMVRVFEAHLAAFEHAAAENAWELRRVFQARLETLFRRHVLLPAAAFEHLALAALEAERLRAELIAHATRRAVSA
jgi:hypothetical protein